MHPKNKNMLESVKRAPREVITRAGVTKPFGFSDFGLASFFGLDVEVFSFFRVGSVLSYCVSSSSYGMYSLSRIIG